MKLFIGVIVSIVLLLHPALAQDVPLGSEVPYIYYYSDALNGLVIERADGTDSRALGVGLVGELLYRAEGPGWSHDGTWFAWHKATSGFWSWSTPDSAYAVHIDGERTLSRQLADFTCIISMDWSPSQNMLLVLGQLRGSSSCRTDAVHTYRLIDADAGRMIADFSVNTESDAAAVPTYPHIVWHDTGDGVRLLEWVDQLIDHTDEYPIRPLEVTMNRDGSVVVTPLSLTSPTLDDFSEPYNNFNPLPPPGYFFSQIDQDAQAYIYSVPPAIDYDGGVVGVYPHPFLEWVFIGHEFCRAGCTNVVGAVTIYNRNTGYAREISNCGGFSACVGWLPSTVNIEALLPGSATSVLPAPISITYAAISPTAVFGGSLLLDGYPYRLECNSQTGQQNQVVNVATGVLEFTLPSALPCVAEPSSQDIVFALSPNRTYYAITDMSRLTTLYAAEDGHIIARLNFFGEHVEFSEDSRFLTTIGARATAVWSVEQLIHDSLTLTN